MDDQQYLQRVAMKAVIVRKGKVLLLREASKTYEDGTNPSRYHFPGGRINPGEPFADGLKREVLEETGLDVTLGQPIYVGEWFPSIKGVKNHIVAVFIVCEASSQEIALSDEHDAYDWVDLVTFKELDIMPPDEEVIKTYFKLISANR